MEVSNKSVYMVGDSTLDNVYWIEDTPKENCIEGKLKAALGEEYTVANHSYDGFTSSEVLGGGRSGSVLPYKLRYTQKRGEACRFVKPLEELEGKVKKQGEHFVVLSVGGNDFREKLLTPWALLSEIPHAQRRYLEIVGRIEKMGVKPILMFQYQTSVKQRPYYIYNILGFVAYAGLALSFLAVAGLTRYGKQLMRERSVGNLVKGGLCLAYLTLVPRQVPWKVYGEALKGKSIGRALFRASLEKLYTPIIEKAIEKRIPIIDLPNQFDPEKAENYVSEIEPSAEGGDVIVGMIVDHVKNYEKKQASLAEDFKNWSVKG